MKAIATQEVEKWIREEIKTYKVAFGNLEGFKSYINRKKEEMLKRG